ncbi:MAG TPA: universal stress protein [Treponema sp.]|nr:universal stress protein [Treponema sp.]
MESLSLFNRIMFCTDFSSESAAAFNYALELSRVCKNAEIIIFHVIAEPDAHFWKTYIYEKDQLDDKARKDIELQFEQRYLSLVPDGTNVTTRIEIGNAGQQILRVVEEEKIDLLIMGRKRKKKKPGMFFGDNAKAMLQKAQCPILIIPEN